MKIIKSRILGCIIASVVFHFALFSASAQQAPPASHRDASQVKALIDRTMLLPQTQDPTAIYYADGISHFDGFIPIMPFMTETNDPGKSQWKFTYHDGRIAKAELVDGSGKVDESYAVWNNSAGAPVLVGDRNKDGSYGWYMYADYDSSGKIQMICRFDERFELMTYQAFSYQDNATDIKEFTGNGKPMSETIYDNGGVFVVDNGEKRLVNHIDRRQAICELSKFGLKPIYPVY